MAPEMLIADSYDKQVDIWATGITCIELAEGAPPLAKLKWQDAIKRIHTLPSPTLKEKEKFSPEFSDFIALCLQKDPAQRCVFVLFLLCYVLCLFVLSTLVNLFLYTSIIIYSKYINYFI